MGIWKEIKYALNSTLGTSYFRPLDDIVNRELESSSSKLYKTITTDSIETEGSGVTTTVSKFVKMFCNGSVTVKANVNYERLEDDCTFYCNVLHTDGTNTEYSSGSVYTDKTMRLEDIKVSKGDVLTFKIKQNKGYSNTITGIYIYATEVQSSLLSVY